MNEGGKERGWNDVPLLAQSLSQRRRFRPPAFVGYFLAISWRHPRSVCRHKVANGGFWEDETTAPKKHLPMKKRSHFAHSFARPM